MKAKRLDHVAIAVPDLEAALATYRENFGLPLAGQGEAPGLHRAALQIGDARLEFLSPTDAQGAVAQFLAARGSGLYLLSLEVDDLDAAVAELRARGIEVQLDTDAAGRRLARLRPEDTHGVLLELRAPGGSEA
ncbi:MAG: hypothetical protein KatS3mg131_1215 [Candidatus Tectimicrobiota bacterium]|nr:MAG: hypothetical protein KatS3mg131_1215 [Candidatus Tectomicrobia bacterium]